MYHCSTSLVLSKRNVMYSIQLFVNIRNPTHCLPVFKFVCRPRSVRARV